MVQEQTALVVNEEALTLTDVLAWAQWQDALGFLRQAADAALIRQAAQRHAIEVTPEELQQEATTFRRRHGLEQASALLSWLEQRGRTTVEWQAHLAEIITTRKVRQAVTEDKIHAYFVQHRLEFEQADLSRLLVRDEGAAQELLARIVEEGEDFHALARQYSEDATRAASGYLGRVGRKTLPPVLEAGVFGAEAGQVVGPFSTSQGWHLLLVESLHPAVLDATTRETIQTALFAEWLMQQRQSAQICTPLSEGVF